jgi:hypothetical protein
MIQRQQSLWLLLSVICSIFSFQLAFYNGTRMVNNMVTPDELNGASTFFLLIFTGASLLLAFVSIFLFKDRKLQFRLCLIGVGTSILTVVFYFLEIKKFATGGISLYCLFPFAVVGGFIMAARGVRKDEKLVKSLDKLR